jgi:RNA polymerase sigma-70 factor (ECF subfamily)
MTVKEYNQLIDNHSNGLYRFILKHIKDEAVAQDIVQDTFEKVWIKVNDISYEKSKSYLYTVAHRKLIDYTRKQKNQEKYIAVSSSDHYSHNQYSDLKQILNEALDKLPSIQKSVIMLRDYEGYDYAEIGQITDLSESQVKVYIFRARTFLKNYLVNLEVVI